MLNKRHAIDNQIQFKMLPVVDKMREVKRTRMKHVTCCITKCVNDNTPLVLSEVKISRTAPRP